MKAFITFGLTIFVSLAGIPAWAYNSTFVASCDAFQDALNNLDRKIEATELKPKLKVTLIGQEPGNMAQEIDVSTLQDLYKLHDQVYAKYALLMGFRNLVQEYENLTAHLSSAINEDSEKPLSQQAAKFYDKRNILDRLIFKRKNTLNIATMDTVLRYLYTQFDNRKGKTETFTVETFKNWINAQAKISQAMEKEERETGGNENTEAWQVQKLYTLVDKILGKNSGNDTLDTFFELHQVAAQGEDPAAYAHRLQQYRQLLNRIVNNKNMKDFLEILNLEEALAESADLDGFVEFTDDPNQPPQKRKVQLNNDGIHQLTMNYGQALNKQLNQLSTWQTTDGEMAPAPQEFQNTDPQDAKWSFKNSVFYQDLWEDIKDQLALNKGNPSLANNLNDTLTAAVAGHYMKQRTAMQNDSHQYLTTLVDEAIRGRKDYNKSDNKMAGSLLESGVIEDIAKLLNQLNPDQAQLTSDLIRACQTKTPFLNENCVDALDKLTQAIKFDNQFYNRLNYSMVGLQKQLMDLKNVITAVEKQPNIQHLESLHQQLSNYAIHHCDSAKYSEKSCYMGGDPIFDGTAIQLLHLGDTLMGTFAYDKNGKPYTRENFNIFCKNLSNDDRELISPVCQQSRNFAIQDLYHNAHTWFSKNRGYYKDTFKKRPNAWSFLPKAIANSLNDPMWKQMMQNYIYSRPLIEAGKQMGYFLKESLAQNEAVNNYVNNLWEKAAQNSANQKAILSNYYYMGALSGGQVFPPDTNIALLTAT